MSYVSKVNKKNTFLMENNNKMLYASKVIKKWVQEKKSFTYWSKLPYQVELIDMGRNLEQDGIQGGSYWLINWYGKF